VNRDAFGEPSKDFKTFEIREDRRVLQHVLSNLLDALEGMGWATQQRQRAVDEAKAVLEDSVAILDERPLKRSAKRGEP
jgi:hypothetical protein